MSSEEFSPAPITRKKPKDQKRGKEASSESGRKSSWSSEASSEVREENIMQSHRHREAKDARQKGPWHRSGGSSYRGHNGRGHLEDQRMGSPPMYREQEREKPGSTRAKYWTRDSRHTKPRVKDRRSHSRPTKRRHPGDTLAALSNSPKRHRQRSPEARSSRSLSQLSRLITHMGALEVTLEDLQAPGGAFLCEPSRSTEPTVSQRAWLSWQLAHAGAALHWALNTVNSILAAQINLNPWQLLHGLGRCPPSLLSSLKWPKTQETAMCLPTLCWMKEASWARAGQREKRVLSRFEHQKVSLS
ncbi:hypothetical protein HispidOSU_022731 [Sigmodon hispidus]